jgi:hypothetical protein
MSAMLTTTFAPLVALAQTIADLPTTPSDATTMKRYHAFISNSNYSIMFEIPRSSNCKHDISLHAIDFFDKR